MVYINDKIAGILTFYPSTPRLPYQSPDMRRLQNSGVGTVEVEDRIDPHSPGRSSVLLDATGIRLLFSGFSRPFGAGVGSGDSDDPAALMAPRPSAFIWRRT